MAFPLTRRTAGVLPCDPGLVYDVLTDYDAYSEWMPFVGHSKLLAREGDLAIAEFDFLKPRQTKMTVECIHAREQTVLGRAIGGDIPVAKIQWSLAPAEGGRTQVSLAIDAKLHWRWLFPGYRRFLNARMLLAALKTHLTTFTVSEDTAEKGDTVLELVETSEGLVVWFRGQKYALTPLSGRLP